MHKTQRNPLHDRHQSAGFMLALLAIQPTAWIRANIPLQEYEMQLTGWALECARSGYTGGAA